jgi:DNA-binding NtrC family response regulator
MEQVTRQPAAGECRRVLVVDDDAPVREALVAMLDDAGYRAVPAADAEAALRLLEVTAVDVVLTDIRMPGLNGLDLLAAVKRHHPAIDVVLITGYGDGHTAYTAWRRGAVRLLAKPVTPADLRAALAGPVLSARDARDVEHRAGDEGASGIR